MRIPLRARDGSVRAHALIDAEDWPLVAGRSWTLHNRGYVVWNTRRAGRSVTFMLHRVLMGLEHGDPREVDHQNGDPLDCRRSNLRVLTHAANGQNITRRRGASRFRNVSAHRRSGRWQVKVHVGGRQHHGGYFEEELLAALAARDLRARLMPFALPDPELERALAS